MQGRLTGTVLPVGQPACCHTSSTAAFSGQSARLSQPDTRAIFYASCVQAVQVTWLATSLSLDAARQHPCALTAQSLSSCAPAVQAPFILVRASCMRNTESSQACLCCPSTAQTAHRAIVCVIIHTADLGHSLTQSSMTAYNHQLC